MQLVIEEITSKLRIDHSFMPGVKLLMWSVSFKYFKFTNTYLQGWVMRPYAQTNARMIRTIRVFNVNASAFRGHF